MSYEFADGYQFRNQGATYYLSFSPKSITFLMLIFFIGFANTLEASVSTS
ncbi:MAG: hypothetical protein IPG85_04390 [Bacteroidetes bacterium]|nr:hypothetical protein [Bacteroidota bacterium]